MAQLSGRQQRRRRRGDDDVTMKCIRRKDEKIPNWSRNLFEKAELLSLPNTCKATQEWKREGEALTSPGNPLTNLTTIKLSRKRSPGTSSRTCVDSMRCKVHPELFLLTSLNPTHKGTIWPGCLEVGRSVQSCGWLISWEVGGLVMVWSEVCFVENSLVWGLLRGKWSGLEVCCVEKGLDWRSAERKTAWSGGML